MKEKISNLEFHEKMALLQSLLSGDADRGTKATELICSFEPSKIEFHFGMIKPIEVEK